MQEKEMKKFYCEVIRRDTRETIKSYPDIEATDWYYARHKVAQMFREAFPSPYPPWFVDSIEIEE